MQQAKKMSIFCLNPFGTGQCLTTGNGVLIQLLERVSIPLEQGNVLRRRKGRKVKGRASKSQSLWNRAMSYDQLKQFIKRKKHVSQSLWNRAMSYDEGYILTIKPIKCLNPFGTGQCLTTVTW